MQNALLVISNLTWLDAKKKMNNAATCWTSIARVADLNYSALLWVWSWSVCNGLSCLDPVCRLKEERLPAFKQISGIGVSPSLKRKNMIKFTNFCWWVISGTAARSILVIPATNMYRLIFWGRLAALVKVSSRTLTTRRNRHLMAFITPRVWISNYLIIRLPSIPFAWTIMCLIRSWIVHPQKNRMPLSAYQPSSLLREL
jgi:hypothetical protein